MKTAEDLHKHTLNLRSGDMDRIRDLVPDVEPSRVVRAIVSAFVDKHEGVAVADLSELNVEIQ